jgi:hypothetical protein
MGEITCYAVDDVKTDENGDLLEKRPKPIYEFSKNSSQMRIIKIIIGCFLLVMFILIIVNVVRRLFTPSKNIAKVAPTPPIKGGFRRR